MNTMTSAGARRLLAPLATIPTCQTFTGEADWFPPVDILEDAEEYLFKIDLPEMEPEGIQVVVESDGLFISGERPQPWQENKKWLRVERPHGYFERRFALPDDASRVKINSVFRNSVLELHVRKVSPPPPSPPTANTVSRLESDSAS